MKENAYKGLLYDLQINSFSTQEEKRDRIINAIDISAYVIIMRDGNYHKVRIRQRYDILEKDHWPTHLNHCMEEFFNRCEQIRLKWRINGDVIEGRNGKIILDEPFNIDEIYEETEKK